MPSDKHGGALSALVAAFACYIGHVHPSVVPALGLAAAVWVGMYMYLKE